MARYLKFLVLILPSAVLFMAGSALADSEYYCSPWERQRHTCIGLSGTDFVWERQCEYPCGDNRSPYCDRTRVCLDYNPAVLGEGCTPWVKQFGRTCYNPNSESFEQKWERVCTIGLKTSWCSDAYPPTR